MIHNMHDLFQQLQQDIELCEGDMILIAGLPSSSHNHTQEASFPCAQAMKNGIYRFKFETRFNNVLIDLCRMLYKLPVININYD